MAGVFALIACCTMGEGSAPACPADRQAGRGRGRPTRFGRKPQERRKRFAAVREPASNTAWAASTYPLWGFARYEDGASGIPLRQPVQTWRSTSLWRLSPRCGIIAAICNLSNMDKAAAEGARWFNAVSVEAGNARAEVYLGYPGYVVADGPVRQMTWGFPLSSKGQERSKAQAEAGEQHLSGQARQLWRFSFRERRSLIPVTQFAEAEGERGAKSRTWFALPDQPIFVVAASGASRTSTPRVIWIRFANSHTGSQHIIAAS